ncbi:MAG: thioredoxin family protein [Rubripirellula sp.]
MAAGLLTTVLNAEMPTYVSSSSIDQSAVVWHESLQSGWEESRRRDVPMVIYITSDNCQYCDAMKRDTWCDQSIRQRLANGFVAIRLTAGRNSETINRINLKMFPATLIGVPQGKIVDHRFGYQPPSEIHGILKRNATNRFSVGH